LDFLRHLVAGEDPADANENEGSRTKSAIKRHQNLMQIWVVVFHPAPCLSGWLKSGI